jgi:hypothetical protein
MAGRSRTKIILLQANYLKASSIIRHGDCKSVAHFSSDEPKNILKGKARMRQVLLATFVLASILLLAIGCSDNVTDPALSSTGLTFEDEFGGYTATSEQPGFGDPELIESEIEEQLFTDAIAGSPEMLAISESPGSGLFRLRAVWGRLSLDTAVTEVTDWSGSLEISRGGIIVRKTIRFEENDQILPRTNRTLVEWQSVTTVHNDGIVFDLVVPRLHPVVDTTITYDVDSLDDTTEVVVIDTIPPDDEPVTVSFETGPYSRSFTLRELAALDTVVTLEDSNQVAFSAFQVSRCPRGILTGRWGHDEDGNGVFRGKWIDPAGRVTGWLQGRYGINDEGRHVFFGKWIDRGGNFEGFLRGYWRPYPRYLGNHGDAMRGAGGWFRGEILNANSRRIGYLQGHYRNAPLLRGGFFQGRWKLDCSDIRPEDRSGPGDDMFDDGFGDGV